MAQEAMKGAYPKVGVEGGGAGCVHAQLVVHVVHV